MIRRRSYIKRTPLGPRKTWLKRSTKPIARSTKRIRSENPVAAAKRKKRYKATISNAHARAQRVMLAIRSGGICECGCEQRFTERDPMQRAHLSYQRFGHELDTDVAAWRRSCNLRERALRKPYRRIA